MADESFTILTLGARGWPRWLWVAASFFVQPQVHIGDEWHKVRWYEETAVPVVAAGAEIGVTYSAPSWGLAPEPKIFVRPGDRLVYRASVWPWRKGKLGPA